MSKVETVGERKSRKPEYNVWIGMLHRCANPKRYGYYRYGGRGIRVCERWQASFEDFLADMGPRPSPDHSIDRIDNDGHYEPGNCRWATDAEQRRNRSDNRVLCFRGESRCLTDWAAKLGLTDSTIQYRLDVMRWSVDRALTEPADLNARPRGESHPSAKLTADDVTEVRRLHAAGMSISAIGRRFGVNHNSIQAIIRGRTWKHISPQSN